MSAVLTKLLFRAIETPFQVPSSSGSAEWSTSSVFLNLLCSVCRVSSVGCDSCIASTAIFLTFITLFIAPHLSLLCDPFPFMFNDAIFSICFCLLGWDRGIPGTFLSLVGPCVVPWFKVVVLTFACVEVGASCLVSWLCEVGASCALSVIWEGCLLPPNSWFLLGSLSLWAFCPP